MKHQHIIASQRLANMKLGLTQVESYLGGINKMLAELNKGSKEKGIDLKQVTDEIEEIQSFIKWIK